MPKLQTGHGFATICHWNEPRALSINEAKILCSFPIEFQLIGTYSEQWARLGNAVMPKMMEAIAKQIILYLKDIGVDKSEYTVISTFAGCGGSSLGYKWAGFKELLAIDFEKNAVETFALNFPEVPVWQRDIKTVTANEILEFCKIEKGELDVLDGSPPCFPETVTIITKNCIKNISDVQVGDEVLTHQLRWRKVLKTGNKEAETIILKGQGHSGLETTPEHPFYVRKLERNWNNNRKTYDRYFLDPEWENACRLQPNKLSYNQKGSLSYFWGSPAKFPELDIPVIEIQNQRSHIFNFSKEFMFILGVWLGDGWIRDGKTFNGNNSRGEVYICCNKKDSNILEQKLNDANIKFSKGSEKTADRFCICSKPLTNWLLINFSQYSNGKKIPIWIYGLSYELRKSFFDGYIFADGHYDKNKNRYKITTINKNLAIGIRLLANTLNLSCSITFCKMKPKTNIDGRIVNQSDFYSISLYEKPRSNFTELDINWGKVRQVLSGSKKTVYNLEVEEDNSYIADGIIVHNCQGFSTAGKRVVTDERNDLFKEYVRLIDGLQPKVFVMENVSGMVKGKMKGKFIEIMKTLKSLNYQVKCKLMNAKYYNVPQSRERLIFIGVRNDVIGGGKVAISFPNEKNKIIIVKEALENCPQGINYQMNINCETFKILCKCKPGQSAQSIHPKGFYFNFRRLPINSISPTIIKNAGKQIFHYKENRLIYDTEAKRLTSFPDNFELIGCASDRISRIGNSVPPKFIQAIAENIKTNMLDRYYGDLG